MGKRKLLVGLVVMLIAVMPLLGCNGGTVTITPNGADAGTASSGGTPAKTEAPKGSDSGSTGSGRVAEGEAPKGADGASDNASGRVAEGEAPKGADSASDNASGRTGEGEAPKGNDSILTTSDNGSSGSGGGGGGNSGSGYPVGTLNMNIPASTLILDRVGTVKANGAQLEVADRQYEGTGNFTIYINGQTMTATSLKVISNLKLNAGVGDHSGTVDVDIDLLPNAGHLALQYNGTANMTGSTIYSAGTVKSTKNTGIFAGIVVDGTYTMTIVEYGQTLGSSATFKMTTKSP